MTDEEAPLGVPGLEPEKTTNWTNGFLHLTALILGFVGPVLLIPTCCGRGSGQLTACKSNCKNIATALEMYSSDNDGKYPRNLEQLIPGNYLKRIPTCPAAGKMTYTDYHLYHQGQSYRFSCEGINHRKAYTGFTGSSEDYPRYDAEQGLIDHP